MSNLSLQGTPPQDAHCYDANPVFDQVWLAYGFRPFFMAAALYAVGGILVWASFWFGLLDLPETVPRGAWHAHEMVFGFAAAAICGFLLTAVPEWTGTRPKTGRWLALVLGIWLAGRIAMWGSGILPLGFVAIVNLALLPLIAFWIIPPLWRDPNKRHRAFIPLLPLLWLMQAVTFLSWMGVPGSIDWTVGDWTTDGLDMRALNGGLHVFLIAIVLTVTRISMVLVPLALDEQGDTESRFMPIPPRRNLATATLIVFAIADFVAPASAITGWIALAAAAAQLDRMTDWHVGRVLLKPYVLTIYIAYAWLAAGLAGLGFDALFGWDAFSASRHALTLGAASTAILAVFMIAGLRHTGRALVIPRLCFLAVLMISAATGLRTIAPTVFPDAYLPLGIGASSLLWAGAFALFLFSFAPILLKSRVDGAPG